MTVKEFLNEWLLEQKAHLKFRTFKRYAEIIGNNVLPILGETALEKLTPKQVKGFLAKISAVHTDNTVLQNMGLLKRAHNSAVQ